MEVAKGPSGMINDQFLAQVLILKKSLRSQALL